MTTAIVHNYDNVHIKTYEANAVEKNYTFVESIFRSLGDTFEGLKSSRIARPIVFAAMVLGAVVALAYLGLTISGWVTLALMVSAAIYGFLSGGSGSLSWVDIKQELGVEASALGFLCYFQYDNITWDGKDPHLGNILLGPLPNRMNLFNSPDKLAKREHLSGVLSVNAPGPISERGERGNYGLLHPFTPQDWQEHRVRYAELDIPDHEFLPIHMLDEAADYIHSIISQGGNIYVHCKAGRGRSAMAIAAYLIKYQHMSVRTSMDVIVSCRPVSTVRHKRERLLDYQLFCVERAHIHK